jgi:hypothetical protein
MRRLLVVDKCVFQGTALDRLLEFVHNHHVVLPYALCVECLMSEGSDNSRAAKDPAVLLAKLDKLVKARVYVGCASSALFRMEKEQLGAAKTIIDEYATQRAQEGIATLDSDFLAVEAETCRRTFEPLIGLLQQYARTYFENVKKKGLCREFRGESQVSDVKRFDKWLQVADAAKTEITRHLFSEFSSSIGNDWYSWQMARLWWAWVIDWACRRNCSGSSFEKRDISNDLHDMEYVAYLSRADGIITRDKKLVEPLARAAFPEKDVFSSLEEVPDSYRCDWSGD